VIIQQNSFCFVVTAITHSIAASLTSFECF